jgi:hypothetical protein
MTRKSTVTALNTMAQFQNTELFGNAFEKTVTFAAATTGAIGFHKLADVTGMVAVQVIPLCTVNVAGTGNISIGTTVSEGGIIPITTGTDIDAGELWLDATPDATIEGIGMVGRKIVTDHIQYRITANTLTGGTIKFVIRWVPISSDGNVVVA